MAAVGPTWTVALIPHSKWVLSVMGIAMLWRSICIESHVTSLAIPAGYDLLQNESFNTVEEEKKAMLEEVIAKKVDSIFQNVPLRIHERCERDRVSSKPCGSHQFFSRHRD